MRLPLSRHREACESGAAARRRPCFNRRRSSATVRIKTGSATQSDVRSQMCRYRKPARRGKQGRQRSRCAAIASRRAVVNLEEVG